MFGLVRPVIKSFISHQGGSPTTDNTVVLIMFYNTVKDNFIHLRSLISLKKHLFNILLSLVTKEALLKPTT